MASTDQSSHATLVLLLRRRKVYLHVFDAINEKLGLQVNSALHPSGVA